MRRGLTLDGGEKPTPADYARLLKQIKPRPDAQLLQTVMLRSMQQAVYSPHNAGHFGLAYEAYTHFTSPIRRYPDLLVHRVIKSMLAKQTYVPEVSGNPDAAAAPAAARAALRALHSHRPAGTASRALRCGKSSASYVPPTSGAPTTPRATWKRGQDLLHARTSR